MSASKSSVAALLAAWDSAESPTAPLTSVQRDAIGAISKKETDDAGTAEDITGLLIRSVLPKRRRSQSPYSMAMINYFKAEY